MLWFIFLGIILRSVPVLSDTSDVRTSDPNGYVVYCPCMGRFGNQADQFLGSLAFAKALNRTLVLPPWIEYRHRTIKPNLVPFDTYFNVNALERFHRVITMIDFISYIADDLWPPSSRTAFCYMERPSLIPNNTDKSCNAKEGNPFGMFWDRYDVEFEYSEFFGPLSYDVHAKYMTQQWMEKYPVKRWPVLAFTGAPASFPVSAENRHLHQFIEWSDSIKRSSLEYIDYHFNGEPFIGIHLRNGGDWKRACDHIKTSPNLFAAAQCLGYRNEKGNATMEMCLPSQQMIIKQLKRYIKWIQEPPNKTIRGIFVATDNDPMIDALKAGLKEFPNLRIIPDFGSVKDSATERDPVLDLAILSHSNLFIGNCISSFTAFVKRHRDVMGWPTIFWGFPPDRKWTTKRRQERTEEL